MTIRILDCAPMSPWFPRWHLGGTCLLVETNAGLTLIDSGLGLHDHSNPSPTVKFFISDFGIHKDPESTAIRQISRLGYTPEEVKHIVLTHLHFDHAGGIADFPHAQVHVHKRELDALKNPRQLIDLAYDRSDFVHNPAWVVYDAPDTNWLGFEAIRLPFTPEMYFIPLFGHTRGHCGVAIKSEKGWVFNCADALPTNAQFDLVPHWIGRLVIGSHVSRIREWSRAHPEVRLLAGHMWTSFFEENDIL
jgi:glyoxylase-like metal-dependent hydrolase (beta-lactamase superfamily II)